MSIQVEQLTKEYGNQCVVDHISFTANKTEILGFLGPNGAGKTTTMKMLTGYLMPSAGSVRICGHDIREQSVLAKRCIGYLPEHNPLYKDMYVREYLLTFAHLTKVQNPNKKVEELIELTGLTQEQNKIIGSLSKGYRQRVGLSQALMHDPEVLILDEPTSGLDPNQLLEIRNLIRDFGKEKTLIFSTHIMQEVQALCDRVIIINKGKIIADDPIEILQAKLHDQQIVHLELNKEIGLDSLQSIPGVIRVKISGKNRYTLTIAPEGDARDQLFYTCAKNNWIIRELILEKNSVEEIFNELTRVDNQN
ncbi:MAG: gliding motility-associated ABC transporter ATP-binding subunit GldA [Bacteroidota bacterium]|nr:gliding motility-associated ABC transporter ATP-binding subunit GldA [Bacteroidota bacterium]